MPIIAANQNGQYKPKKNTPENEKYKALLLTLYTAQNKPPKVTQPHGASIDINQPIGMRKYIAGILSFGLQITPGSG